MGEKGLKRALLPLEGRILPWVHYSLFLFPLFPLSESSKSVSSDVKPSASPNANPGMWLAKKRTKENRQCLKKANPWTQARTRLLGTGEVATVGTEIASHSQPIFHPWHPKWPPSTVRSNSWPQSQEEPLYITRCGREMWQEALVVWWRCPSRPLQFCKPRLPN